MCYTFSSSDCFKPYHRVCCCTESNDVSPLTTASEMTTLSMFSDQQSQLGRTCSYRHNGSAKPGLAGVYHCGLAASLIFSSSRVARGENPGKYLPKFRSNLPLKSKHGEGSMYHSTT